MGDDRYRVNTELRRAFGWRGESLRVEYPNRLVKKFVNEEFAHNGRTWPATTPDNTSYRAEQAEIGVLARGNQQSIPRGSSEIDFNPTAELAKRVFERKNPRVLQWICDPV
jgi:hypothetical protein